MGDATQQTDLDAGTFGMTPGAGLYESLLQHLAVDVFMTSDS